MRKSRFTEHWIVTLFKGGEDGSADQRRLRNCYPLSLMVLELLNQVLASVMSEALMCGGCYRMFNVVGGFDLEASEVEAVAGGIRKLDHITVERGYPEERIHLDNGSKFMSLTLAKWAEQNEMQLDFIEPDKPAKLERICEAFQVWINKQVKA